MFSMRTERWSSPRPDTLNVSADSVSSTLSETSVLSSLYNLSLMWRDVTNLPSWPANGLSLIMKFIEIVGSEIFWNGIATGSSVSQIVSPILRSVIPEMATIEPIFASSTGTRLSPSNSKSFVIRTFSFLDGSWWFTTIASWLILIEPLSTLPTPIRPTNSL